MLKLANTLDIEALEHLGNKVAAFWRRLTTPKVELLDEYNYLLDSPEAVRYVARSRRRCTLNGHIWEFKQMQLDRTRYVVECCRCHPHIDSRRVIISYNPFPTVERKTD